MYFIFCLHAASQAWCLARFLPLLIGDMVPKDDERWDNYLCLLRIMEYMFAPVITVDKTIYSELLIEKFLSEFVELYPWRPLTPKMHYLVHVPMWIRMYVYNIQLHHNSKIITVTIILCFVGPQFMPGVCDTRRRTNFFKKLLFQLVTLRIS